MGEELVRTKLVAPILPGPFVVRSRLHDVLGAAVDRQARLLLVSAPAGSGKSTLLAGWLADRAEPAAWLQVEASESDPARFWSYVVASIGMVYPMVEQAVRPLVAGSAADATALVTALANTLGEVEERLFLVVDDYHLIDSDRVHTSFERLIELCPTSVTVVIGTRVDPPFRLGRLRVRGQLTELRAEDLRFDPSEAGPLLGARSAEVDDGALRRLLAQTEGWAAGLVLAGVSLESAEDIEGFVDGFHGSDRLVVDYLSDEFLSSVSEDDRQRLLQTSILHRLTGSLVDAVCGQPGGDAWLRRISATNQLVIGLDRSGRWFRYHHLLGDLLALEAGESFPTSWPACTCERRSGMLRTGAPVGPLPTSSKGVILRPPPTSSGVTRPSC